MYGSCEYMKCVEKVFDDMVCSSFRAYGQLKLANILHANQLANNLKEEGYEITANSVNREAIITNLMRYRNLVINGVANLIGKYILKKVPQGASTTGFVALSPQVRGVTGEYFVDNNKADSDGMAHTTKKMDLYDPDHVKRVLGMAPGLQKLNILPLRVATYDTVDNKMAFFDPYRAHDFIFISGTKMRTYARIGLLLSIVAYYEHVDNKLDLPTDATDAVLGQLHSLGNSLVAIVPGLFGNLLVDTLALGPVAPFDAASCFLPISLAIDRAGRCLGHGCGGGYYDDEEKKAKKRLSLEDHDFSPRCTNQILMFSLPRPPETEDLEDKVAFKGRGMMWNDTSKWFSDIGLALSSCIRAHIIMFSMKSYIRM